MTKYEKWVITIIMIIVLANIVLWAKIFDWINEAQAHEVQMTATVSQSEMRTCIEEVCGYEFK